MAFALKKLTDKEREQMGFAKTMDDVKLPTGGRLGFVSIVSIDNDNNCLLIPIRIRGKQNKFEFLYDGNPLIVTTNSNETIREKPSDDGLCKYDVNHEVIAIKIKMKLVDQLPQIKELVIEALSCFGIGSFRYNGDSKVKISDDLKIETSSHVKSEFRVSDYITIN
ncbi:MAG: hypothetical protein PQ612_00015 [Rickettsiales bacterium]|nr:hypothetical protein [Pseudomonadota bacterium]MDA0965699.1 hypothetical protein [Pseudomonadota bacterium]MDG4543023.1 hypothetical protein [Rickettsiales bacterium]MDG4544529.1 hypothetical protein [Rickettsiales bacterium]MDG4546651.1 hypothetical protein [Rickettsiales bacterium]